MARPSASRVVSEKRAHVRSADYVARQLADQNCILHALARALTRVADVTTTGPVYQHQAVPVLPVLILVVIPALLRSLRMQSRLQIGAAGAERPTAVERPTCDRYSPPPRCIVYFWLSLASPSCGCFSCTCDGRNATGRTNFRRKYMHEGCPKSCDETAIPKLQLPGCFGCPHRLWGVESESGGGALCRADGPAAAEW